MPKISEKGLNMPSSPIRKLVPYADAAKVKGIKIYHLNIGQPDIETPEVMLNAIKNFSGKVVEYSHSAGIESYRKKLAGYYQKYGIDVNHNDMLITCGGSEAIEIAMMSCLNAGDEVIIPEPFYANYNGFACQADVIVKPIRSYIESGFALPKIEEFEKLISKYRVVKVEAKTYHNGRGGKGSVAGSQEILFVCKPKKKHFVSTNQQQELVNEGL